MGTGAQISVIPATWQDKRNNQPGSPLMAANGTSISTYGTRSMPLKLGHYTYEAQLTLADVQRPLLGADFLRSHDLLVDLRGKRLVQADTLAPTTCSTTTRQQLHLATDENDGNVTYFVTSFENFLI